MKIYENKSRALVRDAVIECTFSSLIDIQGSASSKLSSDLTLFLVCLHAKMGSSLSSAVLEKLVTKIDHEMKENSSCQNSDGFIEKKFNNAVELLMKLYNFDVIQVGVVEGLLDRLVQCLDDKKLKEKSLEVVYRVGSIIQFEK